jgi:hypothetical protein
MKRRFESQDIFRSFVTFLVIKPAGYLKESYLAINKGFWSPDIYSRIENPRIIIFNKDFLSCLIEISGGQLALLWWKR